MRDRFIETAMSLAMQPANFVSGNRKILRDQKVTFSGLLDDFDISDCGFTRNKLTALKRLYYVEDSIAGCQMLWNRCLERRKYSSAGFHCYNHLVKGNVEKKSIRASVMGPCIQSVVLTWLPGDKCAIDIFYRTTEYFKKFPADLIFIRDMLLPQFNFEDCPIQGITFHFANVTIHPMYWVTLVPLMERPISVLRKLKETDPNFWDWIVKWTSRYICDEYYHGIAKFEQAKRVQLDATRRIDPDTLARLQRYVRANHSGFRGQKRDVFG